jgi:hypothetical protein
MASQDRRRKLTIDEINEYWRRLKEGVDSPSAHKICNAVRILDLALNECEAHLSCRLSASVWSKIRDDLFDMLVSSFPGHFLVYPDYDAVPAEPGTPWPQSGTLEFYPEHVKRRDDSCQSDLARVHPAIILRFRWCFAEGRQNTTPADFESYRECAEPSEQDTDEAQLFLDELYQVCAGEATKLKKIAHRRWWQLHDEARNCADRRHKNELRKQMEDLEIVWGTTAP